MLLLALIWLAGLWVAACVTLMGLNLLLTRLIESLVPPVGAFVEVDGLRLHHVDSGKSPGHEAPPLLFLHGWAGQLNHFSWLAELFPERRVVLVDRPGCGYSQAPRSATIQANAALLADFIDRIGLQKPLVIGHSLGGAVALALALDHGAKISGLALLAPFTHFESSPFHAALARQNAFLRWLGAWTLGPWLAINRAMAASDLAFSPDAAPSGFWKRGGALLGLRPRALIGAGREVAQQEIELTAMARRYPSLRLPVSVLFGSGDRLLDVKTQGKAFCAVVPQAQLSMITSGHCAPMTRPRECASFIRAALAAPEGRPS